MQKIKIPNLEKQVLIINELHFCRYSFSFCYAQIAIFWCIFSTFLLFSCSGKKIAPELQTAEDLLWFEPDSCLTFLDAVDYSSMSEHDSLACALMREHALFKMYQLEDDSILYTLKDYFEAHEDYRYAGEACYIIGRNLVLRQNLPLSTFYLKEAEEHLLKAKEVPAQLLGMVYYGLGSSAEYERLFEVATDYYLKSLSHFTHSNDSLYISCLYRNIAKLAPINIDSALILLDSAFQYLPSNIGQGYRLELEKTKHQYCLHEAPETYIYIYHLLCDSLHSYRYCTELCRYYLDVHQLDSVPYYLSLAKLDTANSVWSKEHYLFNKAWYNYEIGQKDSAYFILRDLHLWQTEEIESSAYTRSYMVEQRYDAERERADKLLAQAGKRRAHLVIVIIVTAALLLTAVLLLMLQQERMRKRKKEEENRQLTEQLRHKQQLLKEQLRTRLSISAEIKKQRFDKQNFTEADYNRLLSSVVFLKHEQWEALMQEFDAAYAGLLTDLTKTHSLTGTDRLYVVFIVLGCSTAEISELTSITTQSVSNRKQLLKQHLAAEGSIEDWLEQKAAAINFSLR